MSKKSRRQARPEVFPSKLASLSQPSSLDFNPDYTPVITDLRCIAVLAGSFLVVLLILAILI